MCDGSAQKTKYCKTSPIFKKLVNNSEIENSGHSESSETTYLVKTSDTGEPRSSNDS